MRVRFFRSIGHRSASCTDRTYSLPWIDGVLQTPTTTPDLLDSLEVHIWVSQARFTRDDRISPGRNDRCCSSLSSRFVDFTTVNPTIGREAFHRIRHLFEEPWKRVGIGDRSVGELDGQNVPSLVCGYMQLSPASSATLAPLRRRPLSLADDAQAGGIDDEMEGVTARRSAKLDIQSPRASGEGGVVRGGNIDSHELEERTEESFDTSPGKPKQQFQGESDLDTLVRVLSLAPSLARRQRCRGAECGGGEPDREIAATNKGSVVLGPVGDPVLGLVVGVDLRALRQGGLPTE